jgi:ubiquinone/menaquinone biosynthesis C-methylase UbiE
LLGEKARMEQVDREYARPRAERWTGQNPGNAFIREEAFTLLHEAAGLVLASHRPVLDMGCGNGTYLMSLAAGGMPEQNLYGVDLLQSKLETAKERVPGAHFRLVDARTLPFPDQKFGLVVSFTLLSSLPDRASILSALREARRVLEPGGVLVCYDMRVPNPMNPNIRRVSKRDFKRALGPDADFTPITVMPQLARRLGRFTPIVYPALARFRPLLTHWLVVYRSP